MKGDFDEHIVGDFANTSYRNVKYFFKDNHNVKVIKGVFPHSVKSNIIDTDKFCFVHLDADQYESTINALTFFYPKMVKRGVIVLDDINWLHGVDKAVNYFLSDKEETLIHSVEFQGYIIKK